MLADLGGDAIVEQVVSLVGLPVGAHLHAGGFVGGAADDDARLVVRFLDAGGLEVARQNLDYATPQNRNFETVLLRREKRIAIPAAAKKAAIRVEFRDFWSGTYGAADELFAIVDAGSPLPAPVPLDTDLVTNGSFESGWSFGSPLTPTTIAGWEGHSGSSTVVGPYSDLIPWSPITLISCLIGGGIPNFSCQPGGAGNVLHHNGDAVLRQRIDVRGNAPDFAQFGQRALAIDSFLGGHAEESDRVSVQVTFRDSNLNSLAPLPALGPVTRALRNEETALLPRSNQFPVQPGTAYIDIDLVFEDEWSGSYASADLIEARLVVPTAPTPPPLGVNLIANPGFEVGSLPGSPLQLTVEKGWNGIYDRHSVVNGYGSEVFVPSSSFAATNGLGGQLVRDGDGDAGLQQRIDVSHLKSQIDLGQIEAYAGAWLGGYANEVDAARVEITCLTIAGVQVPGAGGLRILGPVTAADRGNQTTLLERFDVFPLPASTDSILVEVIFDDQWSGTYALADEIEFVLFSTDTGNPVKLPGTNEDLRLFTGVNGPTTSGPGNESKLASTGDVVGFEVLSPLGTYELGPMLVGATVYAPPASFQLLLPDVWLDTSNVVLILGGIGCGGIGCSVVAPGGSYGNFPIPSDLAGSVIRIQALAFAPPSLSAVPANGAYASTEAHEIFVQ
ncbi:hypothetical protein [Engelhardtia mirabilis]